ncbi:MAG: ATP-binding protein, partial [Planctomycetaceae bacterium]
ILREKHWSSPKLYDRAPVDLQMFAGGLSPTKFPDYSWALFKADVEQEDSSNRPSGKPEWDALDHIRQGESELIDIVQDDDLDMYVYYGQVRASRSCLECHNDPGTVEGSLIGMVRVSFPLKDTRGALARNSAVLLTTAIVTAFLAMLAAYAIVRYVIVKPVLHLKDVSDEIARGNLDLRADIRTGDEFEELSQAFNRMLRHMMTVQDELRHVNTDLDGKVDQLAQVNLRLYELNKIKDEFLATMSHELRTPLNSILGFSDVLANADNLTEKQSRYVDNIQTSGKALTALINDLLDLAKIESGKMELQPVEFQIGDLVERQVGSLAPLAERKNINLSWEVDDKVPLLLQDPGKLQQIMNNLLSNAIKFTPEGGRVCVRAGSCGDGKLQLVVEDTGIGIPLEEQATIFEKFRQGDTVPGQHDRLVREFEGTGLGLSIVKELCKLLGGEILLESEFGKGSTFSVRIPIRIPEDTPSGPFAERRQRPSTPDAFGGRPITQSAAHREQQTDPGPSSGTSVATPDRTPHAGPPRQSS